MSRGPGPMIALVGVIGWAGLIWIGIGLYGTQPPTAGFDLEILLRAGREVAAGRSPYDPAMVAGAAPVAERLFYSYPPLVAQAMSLVAGLPSALVFVAWDAAAVGGYLAIVALLARRFGLAVRGRSIVLTALALVPVLFPFAIGLLFGNLDVFFPSLFGLMLLAVLPAAAPADRIAGGVSTAIAGIAKLHPASMGLWFLARSPGWRGARRVFLVAVLGAVALLGASLVVGGPQPWIDYLAVVRAGSGADLVDPRNGGPAAQIALIVGGAGPPAEALARALLVPVTLGALAVTVIAAWRVRDAVDSLAWAAAASQVILPVTCP